MRKKEKIKSIKSYTIIFFLAKCGSMMVWCLYLSLVFIFKDYDVKMWSHTIVDLSLALGVVNIVRL